MDAEFPYRAFSLEQIDNKVRLEADVRRRCAMLLCGPSKPTFAHAIKFSDRQQRLLRTPALLGLGNLFDFRWLARV